MSQEIIQAIQKQNPFDKHFVVRSRDIWESKFPDISSINNHASNAVFQAIEKVRIKQREVVGITITAERGLGKSHVISRIRNYLKSDGNALFVYMTQCSDLNRIKTEFLQNLANSLKQIGSQGVSQWQELATALFNESLNKNLTAQQIISSFSKALARNPKLVEALRDQTLKIKSGIENPDILTAIFWTLSPESSHETYAINWLSGMQLPESKASELGLPNPMYDNREAESFSTTRQIIDLISAYKPIVICFDEIENNPTCNELGYTGSQVAALFGKDLYEKIKSGVLLTTLLPEKWTHEVKRLPNAESVADRIGEQVIDLRPLNSDDVVALVSQWLGDFYQEKGLIPPHPVYPFDEAKLRELGKERPIVRKVLQWCAENINVITPPHTQVELAYKNEIAALDNSIDDYMENKAVLADALWLGFSALIGETVENVQIDAIHKIDSYVYAVDKGYLDYRIDGKENGKDVKIGFTVLQQSGGVGVQATIKRLTEYDKFNFTRGCLIRSKQINSGAVRAREYLDKLLSPELGGEWVMLRKEDIKTLLAIYFVWNAASDYELNPEEILEFIREKRIAIDNYLIREILSNPSGQIPEEAINEENDTITFSLPKIPVMAGVGVENLF